MQILSILAGSRQEAADVPHEHRCSTSSSSGATRGEDRGDWRPSGSPTPSAPPGSSMQLSSSSASHGRGDRDGHLGKAVRDLFFLGKGARGVRSLPGEEKGERQKHEPTQSISESDGQTGGTLKFCGARTHHRTPILGSLDFGGISVEVIILLQNVCVM